MKIRFFPSIALLMLSITCLPLLMSCSNTPTVKSENASQTDEIKTTKNDVGLAQKNDAQPSPPKTQGVVGKVITPPEKLSQAAAPNNEKQKNNTAMASANQKKQASKVSLPKEKESQLEMSVRVPVPVPVPAIVPETVPATKLTLAPLPLVTISGSVILLGKNGEQLNPEGVIINLEPLHENKNESLEKKNKHIQPAQYRIDMRNKTYMPGLIAVKLNDLVSFVNKDNIKHNTFSSSGENTFDLGTYGSGEIQSTKLLAPGIVKVYCNIHPEMASFISVSEHNYSFITQGDGKFIIKNLPVQQYTLSAWHIRGELRELVDLTKGSIDNYIVSIDTANFIPAPHKNKFGETYKVKPVLFDDEFY